MVFYSNKFKEEAATRFLELKSYRETAVEFGVSATSIASWVRERHPNEAPKSKCKNPKGIEVEQYTDKVLGYLCGLIASDGCLAKQRKGITFQLAEDDISTVEYFKAQCLLNYKEVKLSKIKTKKYWKDQVSCKDQVAFRGTLPRLYDFCMSIGITPAKSKTLDVNLDGQTDEFKWYFLRGMIDGDGSVKVADSVGGCCITIVGGSIKMMETLIRIFGGTLSKGPTAYHLKYKGRMAQRLTEKLPLEDVGMERKTVRLKQILTRTGRASPFTNSVSVGEIWGILEKQKSLITIWEESLKVVSYNSLVYRLSKGWSMEKALTTPPQGFKPYIKNGKLVGKAVVDRPEWRKDSMHHKGKPYSERTPRLVSKRTEA